MGQAMEAFPELVLMGQDIAEYGGVFKVTDGFVERFGKERVRNTPLCESAIVGAALGLSIAGKKAMMEMQFSDFVTVGFNQIVNNLAKIHWRWGQQADVVVRMPTGGNVGPDRSTASPQKRGFSTYRDSRWSTLPRRQMPRAFASLIRRSESGAVF